jgi:hypothetical protein
MMRMEECFRGLKTSKFAGVVSVITYTKVSFLISVKKLDHNNNSSFKEP